MYCSNCGKKIQDEAKYCMYCGAKVIKEEEIEEVKQEPVEEETTEEINKPVEVEAEVVEETSTSAETEEEVSETIEENSEVVEEPTNEDVKTEVVEEKVEPYNYEVNTNNSTVTIEPKKEKSNYLSTVLTINLILLAFKVLGAIFVLFAMNTNSFNRSVLSTVRVYGMYNLGLIRTIICVILLISIVYTGVIVFFEFKSNKNRSKSDAIVSFILTCAKYAYVALACIFLAIFGLTFASGILIIVAVIMILLTYKALQEAKEKFN